MIFLAIRNSINNSHNSSSTVEIDPASQGNVVFTGYTPENGDGILWLGYEELNQRGLSESTIDNLKKIIREYSKYDWKNNLKRVSLYKDSYALVKSPDGNNYHKLKLALNINEKDIFVKILINGYENYEIKLYPDDKYTSEIKSLKFCSILICKPDSTINNTIHNDGHE